MTIESMIEKRQLRRTVEGIAAALLPFEADGSVAVEAFQRHLVATQRAGLMNAVNMDTGYVNYLGDAEKCEVLRWTREALAGETPIGRWSGLLSLAGCRFCFRRRGCMGSRRRRRLRLTARFAGDFRGCWRLSWVRCSRRTGRFLMKRRCGG